MSPKWRLLCLICGFALLSIIFTACMSADDHLKKGDAYFDSDQLEEAIIEYDQAIEIDPEYALAYYHRGVTYDREGKLDLAIADYGKAIGLGINSAQLYYDRGIAYAKKEQWDLAIADYGKAIGLGIDGAQVYYNRGFAYEREEQWDQAVRDYKTCVTIYPDDRCTINSSNALLIECHYKWALSLLRDRQYDAAIQELDVIIREHPDSQYASKARETLDEYFLFDSAEKHKQNGEYTAAIDEFKALVSKYPEGIFISSINEALPECYYQYTLFLMHFMHFNYSEALDNYEIVLRDYPDSIWATKENAEKVLKPGIVSGKLLQGVIVHGTGIFPRLGAVSQKNTILLAKACKADVNEILPYLKNIETVAMYYPLLKIGDPTTIGPLIEALNSYGSVGMAEDYLNCGNDELANAAQSWVSNHPGYRIETVPGVRAQPWWGNGL